jgi:hypothetical protein
MSKEIQEGNKLIAEFMGNVTDDQQEWVNSDKMLVAAYCYEVNWNELMPVHNKCLKVIYELLMSDKQPMLIRDSAFVEARRRLWKALNPNMETKMIEIEDVYKDTLQFITWYNQQNT